MKTTAAFSALVLAATSAQAGEEYKIVDLGGVGDYWNFEAKAPWPDFPHSSIRKRIDVCFAIGFSVEHDGHADNVTILNMKSSNNDPEEIARMKKAMVDGVSGWRFVPSETNLLRTPLYTYTITSMSYATQGSIKEVRERHAEAVSRACVISDFVEQAAHGDIGVHAMKLTAR